MQLTGSARILFLWRFAYGFTFGERWGTAPQLDLDLVREDERRVEAVVFSVSIGFDF